MPSASIRARTGISGSSISRNSRSSPSSWSGPGERVANGEGRERLEAGPMDRLELLRRRQDEVEPLGDDVGDRLGAQRGVEDVGGDLGVELDLRRGRVGVRGEPRDEDRLHLVRDERQVARLDHAAQAVGRLGALGRDDPPVAARDGERLRRAARGPRVVEDDRRPDRRLRVEPRLEARDVRRVDDLDPPGVRDRRAERRRQVVEASRAPPSAPVGRQRPRVVAGALAVAATAADDRVEVERELEALAAERARPDRPARCPSRPAGPSRPAPPRPSARRDLAQRRILSPGLSPDIAGSRSIRVRNSYSRKSRMTVSRS